MWHGGVRSQPSWVRLVLPLTNVRACVSAAPVENGDCSDTTFCSCENSVKCSLPKVFRIVMIYILSAPKYYILLY